MNSNNHNEHILIYFLRCLLFLDATKRLLGFLLLGMALETMAPAIGNFAWSGVAVNCTSLHCAIIFPVLFMNV